MSGQKTEIAVGTAVMVIAVGFLVYAMQVAGLGNTSSSYPLSASFRSLEGINVGSDVRLAGVKIGTVEDIILNSETYRADAFFAIARGVEIPDDSAVLISSEGLLGGNYVEIQPGGSPFMYTEGDEILDTQGAVSLISLLLKFVSGSSE